MSFARTKIQPPRPRPGTLIERPALQARLAEALVECRLVLVCAAAGFGKTSLLARQLDRLPAGTAVAWVACDDGDSPARLLECLIAALEPFDPPWRVAPEALMRTVAEAAVAAQLQAAAVDVINALDACDVAHGVLVIDDLHRISHPLVFALLDALLERLTSRWTLAIASRHEPPLALARLRAQGEIAEFRLAELRFERDEALALAARSGVAADVAERLFERTQGWPAGMRLALNTAGTTRGAGAAAGGAIDRHAFEFMTTEVIDQLPPELRHFLLTTSVLPELTAQRCAALSGDEQAALRIEQIERSGLFATPVASAEPALRLHDLFRESLETRLQRDNPERWREVLERAAATETDPLRRVAWWQRAEAWDEADPSLAEAAEGAIAGGQAAALQQLLDAFPARWRERSPALHLVRMRLAWLRWDWAAATDDAARAAELYALSGDREGEYAARSYRCVALAGDNADGVQAAVDALLADPQLQGPALARTLLAASWVALRGGDQRDVAPLWQRLHEVLSPLPTARWYECSPLPPFIGLPAMREPLQRYVDAALARLPDHPTPLRGMCLVVQGWQKLWVGDIEGAEACVASADEDSRWLARPVNVESYARALSAVLAALRGRHAEAAALCDGLLAEATAAAPTRPRVYRGLYLHMAQRCAAIAGDEPRLIALADALAADAAAGRSWLAPPLRASAPAYAAMAAGDLDTACARWRSLLAHEHVSDLYGQVGETRLRLADALLRRGRPISEAAAVLQPLFGRLAASGEWGATWMAGPAVLQRLAAADWGEAIAADARARLQDFAARAAALAASGAASAAAAAAGAEAAAAPAAAHGLATGNLSARERDVLERIAAGESNKLIARALDLSPHTVKRHVANILDKLALSSRGQAAAWFHGHG